ncbi:hypothetical protein [Mesorhizobium sp.]|uniref:hypothetical protein n=1 Tax=Mesorhizobium sp. TaxID=1871066 RepID=UPI0025C2D75A|nr:hypothetical protein [Mesorhizobium sp.]
MMLVSACAPVYILSAGTLAELGQPHRRGLARIRNRTSPQNRIHWAVPERVDGSN